MVLEAIKIIIEPRNGSNYATRKVQCKIALVREELWNIVNKTKAAPLVSNNNEALIAKYDLRRDRALATTLVDNLTNTFIYLVQIHLIL